MPNKHKKKIIKYRHPIKINIGIVIFSITFLYLAINCILYLTQEKTEYYEVTEGSSTSLNVTYNGIALRDEQIASAKSSGYINYYVREGTRVNLNSTLYTMDSTGKVNELLKNLAGDTSVLSGSDLKAIQNDVNGFSSDFSAMQFHDVYSFKYSLQGVILQLINSNSLESINKQLKKADSSFEINTSEASGILVYSVDGFEQKTDQDITMDDFDKSKYQKAELKTNALVEKGDPIYKTIQDETWSIVIPMSDKDLQSYSDVKTVKVKFSKDGLETTASFKIIANTDGTFGKITLNKYMLRYARDRFLTIQLTAPEETGLKIPKTSVLQKTFYSIPSDYATISEDGKEISFNVETSDKDGNVTAKKITPTIYNKSKTDYLVDMNEVKEGTVLIKSDSNDRYHIGKTRSLLGAFCTNSGFSVFRMIQVLSESNDYYIISEDTSFGLSVYDHIVLDVTSGKIEENQIITH